MATSQRAAPGYRLRPAPRRASNRRPATRVHWDKLGRVALVLVLFAIIASYVGPTIHLVGTWREAHSTQSDLATLQRENTALRARAAALNQPGAAEEAARRLGMVAPGERSYEVRGLKH